MVRCLICDDSALMRQLVSRILREHGIEVVGLARNGQEAIEAVLRLQPDVVTLDVEMPLLSGLEALTRIMESRPTPVVMLSNLTARETPASVEALARGAVDVMQKPGTALNAPGLSRWGAELALKVKVAAMARPRPVHVRKARVYGNGTAAAVKAAGGRRRPLVIVGASTGGPAALCELFAALDPSLLPVPMLVVQHMPAGFTRSLAERLDGLSGFNVREATAGDRLVPGEALLAPGGTHLVLMPDGRSVDLSTAPPRHHVRPAVDVTMESAVAVYPDPIVAVILTGMGSDGATGVRLVRKRGGRAIVQDESTCAVYGMPRAVAEAGDADLVCPLGEIAPALIQTVTVLSR